MNWVNRILHIWGLFWLISLSLLLLETNTAIIVILIGLPFTYIICQFIYNVIFNQPDEETKEKDQ